MNNNFTLNNETCQFSQKACRRNSAHMLPVTDWLSDLPENTRETDLVEIQFKNTRKGYYRNTSLLPLEKGAKVIVEANPGYDLGEVVLTGRLVLLQMNKNHIDTTRYEIRSVLRFATEEDMERAAEAHAKELLKEVGLSHRLTHRAGQLSGGEQQRVAIARALANSPALLLADEPTGNLDPKTADEVFDTFLKIVRQTGLSALLATHNPELAAKMDRRISVVDGCIAELQ